MKPLLELEAIESDIQRMHRFHRQVFLIIMVVEIGVFIALWKL